MNKKKQIIIMSIVIALIGIVLIFSTGRARTDVYLKDFKLSADGKTMTLKVGVSSSSGYVRKMKRTSGSMNYYYTFYSTYGINSKIGAKDTFEIKLDENVDEIYFYTGDKGYRLELVRNTATKKWEKINYKENNTLKMNLFAKDEITKVAIDTYALDNNYFEYNDKNTIEKLYNIFSGLETKEVNKNYNPENPEEMYRVVFFNDENMLIESDNDIFRSDVEVYRKNGKYYAEQRYNGIYKITEEDFNTIKSYVK